MSLSRAISLTVNGAVVSAVVEGATHLADFLREQRDLTGTHLGCEHGVCGACTVLIDGEPARSCITLAAACDGADVRTVEGLDDDPVTTRLRAAFKIDHGLQCGYCTPGMLVTARDIVRRLPQADEARSASNSAATYVAAPVTPVSSAPSGGCWQTRRRWWKRHEPPWHPK